MTTTTKRATTAEVDLVSEALGCSRDVASRRIKLGCPTTTREVVLVWQAVRRPRATAVVLEVLADRAVVSRTDSLITEILKVNGVKLGRKVYGCRACVEALWGLRGEPGLTPREKKHGQRVLHVQRVTRPGPVEKLLVRCGTCGHKLKLLPENKVDPVLWTAVPSAR